MIARQMRPVLCHQVSGRFFGQQRAGQAVTQVDDMVNAALLEIRHHGLQRQQIAVNIRDNGNTQGNSFLTPVEHAIVF